MTGILRRAATVVGVTVAGIIVLGWAIEWVSGALWLLPLILFLAYFFKFDRPSYWLHFNLLFGAAAAACGPWTVFLTRVALPVASPVVRQFFYIPARQPGDVDADAVLFPELVGFVTAIGVLFFTFSFALIVTARSSESESRRRLYFRLLSSTLVTSIVLALWSLGFHGTAILSAVGGGIYSLVGTIMDPAIALTATEPSRPDGMGETP